MFFNSEFSNVTSHCSAVTTLFSWYCQMLSMSQNNESFSNLFPNPIFQRSNKQVFFYFWIISKGNSQKLQATECFLQPVKMPWPESNYNICRNNRKINVFVSFATFNTQPTNNLNISAQRKKSLSAKTSQVTNSQTMRPSSINLYQ